MREVHLTEEKVSNFVDVMSDSMFIYPIDEALKLRAKHKDTMSTYFYMLTFPGFPTLANMANDGSYRRPSWKALRGASHGSDMLLIFPMFDDHPDMPEEDVEVSRKLIRLIIDFGKEDRGPVEGWRPLDNDSPSYLQIDRQMAVREGMPLQERMAFWNSLPPVYWRHSTKAPSHPKDEL